MVVPGWDPGKGMGDMGWTSADNAIIARLLADRDSHGTPSAALAARVAADRAARGVDEPVPFVKRTKKSYGRTVEVAA